MADNTNQQPTGLNWLEEVKMDAEFNFKQRLQEQEARAKFEESKQKQPSQEGKK